MSDIYRHYKNKFYRYVGVALHSETLEELVVYKALYKNDKGDLWVRPKGMFFEQVDLPEGRQDRFANVKFEIQSHGQVTSTQIDEIRPLLVEVFPDFAAEKLIEKLQEKHPLLLVAKYKGEVIGFKWGYEENPDCFYSWIGGVKPSWRGYGVASLLMEQQHKACGFMGYKKVRTKTMNRWKAMLILNIKNGFQIIGTETSSRGDLKVLLEKSF